MWISNDLKVHDMSSHAAMETSEVVLVFSDSLWCVWASAFLGWSPPADVSVFGYKSLPISDDAFILTEELDLMMFIYASSLQIAAYAASIGCSSFLFRIFLFTISNLSSRAAKSRNSLCSWILRLYIPMSSWSCIRLGYFRSIIIHIYWNLFQHSSREYAPCRIEFALLCKSKTCNTFVQDPYMTDNLFCRAFIVRYCGTLLTRLILIFWLNHVKIHWSSCFHLSWVGSVTEGSGGTFMMWESFSLPLIALRIKVANNV